MMSFSLCPDLASGRVRCGEGKQDIVFTPITSDPCNCNLGWVVYIEFSHYYANRYPYFFLIIFNVFVVVGFTKKAGSSRKEKTRKR